MIYAKNAAITQISDLAFEKCSRFCASNTAMPPASIHLVQGQKAVEQARRQVADAIGAKTTEITFTSGGYKANSWVLLGIADSFKGEPIHIITTSIKHHSVLNACHTLESMSLDVTFLPIGDDGAVSIESLKTLIRPITKFVSIMLANNEIGTIQMIAEIGAFLHQRRIWLHKDAVQAVGHIQIKVG